MHSVISTSLVLWTHIIKNIAPPVSICADKLTAMAADITHPDAEAARDAISARDFCALTVAANVAAVTSLAAADRRRWQ